MDMSVGPLRWLSAEELMLLNYGTGDKGDAGLIPGLGRSPGKGHDNPRQYSSLENPMDKGAWRATAHSVTKSQTQLKRQHTCIARMYRCESWTTKKAEYRRIDAFELQC